MALLKRALSQFTTLHGAAVLVLQVGGVRPHTSTPMTGCAQNSSGVGRADDLEFLDLAHHEPPTSRAHPAPNQARPLVVSFSVNPRIAADRAADGSVKIAARLLGTAGCHLNPKECAWFQTPPRLLRICSLLLVARSGSCRGTGGLATVTCQRIVQVLSAHAATLRAGGAMNSGPTGSAIVWPRIRSISALAGAASHQPATSSTGCSWPGWRAPHSASGPLAD
jgi:hypothetical protein